MAVNGRRQWVKMRDLGGDISDFEAIGDSFERATGRVQRGRVAAAEAALMPQRPLVDHAVRWMEDHRRP